MEELIKQIEAQTDDTRSVSSMSDQLEQDYRRFAHRLDGEVIG